MLTPFAREEFNEALQDLERIEAKIATLVHQECAHDSIPASVIENLEAAISDLQAALDEPDPQTVAEANMAARRKAWNEAEDAWATACQRHDAACSANKFLLITDGQLADENLAYRQAEEAYRVAFEDAEKAGFAIGNLAEAEALKTFRVSVSFQGAQEFKDVQAASTSEAIEAVKASYSAKTRQWATFYVNNPEGY